MAETRLGPVVRYLRDLAQRPTLLGLSDGQLLRRFLQDKDQDAFAALMDRHGDLVWRVCRRGLNQAQDAEDAFQATFLVLVRKAGSVRKTRSLASWLYGVAWRIVMKTRKRTRSAAVPNADAELYAPNNPVLEASWRELERILTEEVHGLADKHRAPFLLCCLEGKSRQEAAQELGWKEGTLSSRLAEARLRLQAKLARRGVTLASLLALVEVGRSFAAPVSLTQSTVQAAGQIGLGAAGSSLISSSVQALMEGALRTMMIAKIKTLGLVGALAALVVWWAGVASLGGAAPQQDPTANPPAPPRAGLAASQAPDPAPAQPAAQPPTQLEAPGQRVQPAPAKTTAPPSLAHKNEVRALVFTPDGRQIITASGKDIFMWDVASGRIIRGLSGHTQQVRDLAVSPDGKIVVSAGWDRFVIVWDLTTGRQLLKCGHKNVVHSVAISADGKLIASGGRDGDIHLWNPATGELVHKIDQAHPGDRMCLRFRPGSQILGSCGEDKTVKLWDAATGKRILTLEGPQDTWDRLAFSPDGKKIALAGAVVKLCDVDVATGQQVWSTLADQVQTLAIAYSPDGQMLASGGLDRVVRLWEAATGKLLAQFQGHTHDVTSVAFSGDNRLLASAGKDGMVRFVNLGEMPARLPGPEVRVVRAPADPRLDRRQGDYLWLLDFANKRQELDDNDRALLQKLEKSHVAGKDAALKAALQAKLNAEGLDARESWHVVGLMKLGRDLPGFALEELVWIVRFVRDGQVTQEMWVGSQAGAVRAVLPPRK